MKGSACPSMSDVMAKDGGHSYINVNMLGKNLGITLLN